MHPKPKAPYPLMVMAILRRGLPTRIYRRYVGRHDDESKRLWACNAQKVPASGGILDIGAFHGDFALLARAVNPHAAIYAFEPNPYTLPALRPTCEKGNIVLLEVAVAETCGSLPFVCAGEESTIVEPVASSNGTNQVSHVEAITLDSWTAKAGVSPSLVKIDVEGAEAGILRGAQRVLHEHHPIILCEVLTDAAGNEVMASLPKDYHFYHIDENGGTKEKACITRRRWRDTNWLLVPKHRIAECCF